MQVKLMFVLETRISTCITDTWYGCYAGKSDVFFVILDGNCIFAW